MSISAKDKRIIQDLARRVAEIAALPAQAEKAALWRRFNKLEQVKPLVLIFPEGSWRETGMDEACEVGDEAWRGHEWGLRAKIYYHEVLKDDNVVWPTIHSPIVIHNTGFGIAGQTTRPDEPTGAAHYDPVIVRQEDFFEKVKKPEVTVDWAETERLYQQHCEIYDGILPVEKGSPGAYTSFALLDQFSLWRGLDQFMLDMIDNPAWFHRCLQFMTDCTLEILDTLERENALTLNNGANYVSSGGVGFSDELPQPDFDGRVRNLDQWGFATTQIFSEVSPAMHDEFALRYEIQFLERFGLNCYGCCEPLDLKMAEVKKIPRLRRISMSPWVDLARGAGELGDKYIYSRKPNPAMLASDTWDPDFVRKSTREDLEKTRGCVVELIMKDTHTVRHEPLRLAEWVRIAKEEVEDFVS